MLKPDRLIYRVWSAIDGRSEDVYADELQATASGAAVFVTHVESGTDVSTGAPLYEPRVALLLAPGSYYKIEEIHKGSPLTLQSGKISTLTA